MKLRAMHAISALAASVFLSSCETTSEASGPVTEQGAFIRVDGLSIQSDPARKARFERDYVTCYDTIKGRALTSAQQMEHMKPCMDNLGYLIVPRSQTEAMMEALRRYGMTMP